MTIEITDRLDVRRRMEWIDWSEEIEKENTEKMKIVNYPLSEEDWWMEIEVIDRIEIYTTKKGMNRLIKGDWQREYRKDEDGK